MMGLDRPDDQRPVAMVDESYRMVVGGLYVMAAAVAVSSEVETIRQQLRQVPPQRKKHFHWVDESEALREKMLCVIEGLNLLHVVVAATPVNRRRQTRARGICLNRLMWELHHRGVEHVMLESRGDQDTQDRRVIGGLRNRGVIPRTMTFEFGTKQDPELWVPDAVAGAVATDRCDGDSRFVDLLTDLETIVLPEAV